MPVHAGVMLLALISVIVVLILEAIARRMGRRQVIRHFVVGRCPRLVRFTIVVRARVPILRGCSRKPAVVRNAMESSAETTGVGEVAERALSTRPAPYLVFARGGLVRLSARENSAVQMDAEEPAVPVCLELFVI